MSESDERVSCVLLDELTYEREHVSSGFFASQLLNVQ